MRVIQTNQPRHPKAGRPETQRPRPRPRRLLSLYDKPRPAAK
ncbi:MAG TPA: hypothetical protein VF526_20505 [Solirubrobacteraceae bacterium]|jgi:hypothetical protein